MSKKWKVITFYRFSFIPDNKIAQIKRELEALAAKNQVFGLVIIASEGVNTTFSGSEKGIQAIKDYFEAIDGFQDLNYKESIVAVAPFRRFKIQIRDEIVTLNRPDLKPNEKDASHLEVDEWQKILESDDDYLVIDTRNWYETEIGKFKKAIAPDISEFTEFPNWLEKNKIPKEKKILIYCTGGIRCEKASLDMKEKGYNEVFQLKDGILKYLEKYPNKEFEGECFVFDHRVAVDQNLEASKNFDLCPHCGQPSKNEIQCIKCDSSAKVCKLCLAKEKRFHTCSKNCAHHYDLNPNKKTRPHSNAITSYRDLKKRAY